FLDLRVLGEEIQALVQRHGMGKYALNLGKSDTFQSNQIVHDTHTGLPHDRQLEIDQMIVVLMDTSNERIFDRHYGARRAAVLQITKEVLEALTREHVDAVS